jgi:hypothetical protein
MLTIRESSHYVGTGTVLSLNVGCGGTKKYSFMDLECDVNRDIQKPEQFFIKTEISGEGGFWVNVRGNKRIFLLIEPFATKFAFPTNNSMRYANKLGVYEANDK